MTWSRAATAGDHYDIFEIEAVGPALILHNFGHLIAADALWLHFIDNDAALATLVKRQLLGPLGRGDYSLYPRPNCGVWVVELIRPSGE